MALIYFIKFIINKFVNNQPPRREEKYDMSHWLREIYIICAYRIYLINRVYF